MTIGTEHEYTINNRAFQPLPVSDEILSEVCGKTESEASFGKVTLCKELQKTVLEFIPKKPSDSLFELEDQVFSGISRFYHRFGNRYRLLGLGMHPTLTLDQTRVWDHDEGEYYEIYDRLFSIQQHGWLNIQALQINVSYSNDEELVSQYNTISSLLPYLIAITASSPFVEGKLTGSVDNRLIAYRQNQEQIPILCNDIIPVKINSVSDYRNLLKKMYRELRKRNAGILCEEWVNSHGAIVRFSRKCIEVKALDGQECVRSDMAVCAFLRALIRSRNLDTEDNRETLLELTDTAIHKGTELLRPELLQMFSWAEKAATREEQTYLPIIKNRICHGSLGEQIRDRFEITGDIRQILGELEHSLRTNRCWQEK